MALTMFSKENKIETVDVKKQALRTNRTKLLKGIRIESKAFKKDNKPPTPPNFQTNFKSERSEVKIIQLQKKAWK